MICLEEIKVDKCKNCRHNGSENGWTVCDRCVNEPGLTDRYSPLTKGDKIRSMTDEALARVLTDMISGGGDFYCKNLPECDAALEEDRDIPEENCERCMVDWLRSAAEVADDGKDKAV